MNWDLSQVTKDDYYHLLSMIQVKNDCETFKALLPTLNQPIILLTIMPYLSLFCKAYEEYCNDRHFHVKIQNNSPFLIEDTRAKLKLFNERYSRSLRYIEEVDHIQDDLFKKRLKFSFLKRQNMNYNLGVFFDKDGKIISNTQFLFSLFQGKKLKAEDLAETDLKEYGEAIGKVIASVSLGLSNFMPQYNPHIKNVSYSFSYDDYNTDKTMLFSSGGKLSKSESMALLHTLGTVNFARQIIGEIALSDNPWRLRSQYITMYYAYRQIDSIASNTRDEEIAKILKSSLSKLNTTIISRDFRSCMMHYGFSKNDVSFINDGYLDFTLPFGGLVESCFDGVDFKGLINGIDENLSIISDCISSFCLIDFSNAKPM